MSVAEKFNDSTEDLMQEIRHLVVEFQREWGLIPLTIEFKPTRDPERFGDFDMDVRTFTR